MSRCVSIGARALALLALVFAALPASAGFEAELRTRIERFVEARAGAPVQVELPSLRDFAVEGPTPRIELSSAESPARGGSGALPVTVTLSRGGDLLKRGVVTARLRVAREVLVAARSLRRGEIIAAEDLRPEQRRGASAAAGTTADPALLVGMRLRRGVSAGTPVRRGWVEAPPLVKRGQIVRLVLDRGGLRIEGTAKLAEDGRAGDLVRAFNVVSRREVQARVGPNGELHVPF